MTTNIEAEIHALQQMTTGELADRYAELHGRPCRTRHKAYLTRLRFTNLGEHSPSGGDRGLWGRLGESSRPAYAVLELALEHGERLLAGVHLQRKPERADLGGSRFESSFRSCRCF